TRGEPRELRGTRSARPVAHEPAVDRAARQMSTRRDHRGSPRCRGILAARLAVPHRDRIRSEHRRLINRAPYSGQIQPGDFLRACGLAISHRLVPVGRGSTTAFGCFRILASLSPNREAEKGWLQDSDESANAQAAGVPGLHTLRAHSADSYAP